MKLSIPRTTSPRASRAADIERPIKPAAPVTRYFANVFLRGLDCVGSCSQDTPGTGVTDRYGARYLGKVVVPDSHAPLALYPNASPVPPAQTPALNISWRHCLRFCGRISCAGILARPIRKFLSRSYLDPKENFSGKLLCKMLCIAELPWARKLLNLRMFDLASMMPMERTRVLGLTWPRPGSWLIFGLKTKPTPRQRSYA
jgi:hypothetical protein